MQAEPLSIAIVIIQITNDITKKQNLKTLKNFIETNDTFHGYN